MGRDPDAAVVDLDGRRRGRGVVAQVGHRDERPDVGERPGLPFGEIALVEGIEPVAREGLERRGQGWEADALAGSPRAAVRAIDGEEPGVRSEVGGDEWPRSFDRIDESVPGREPVPCQLDGRGQDRVA